MIINLESNRIAVGMYIILPDSLLENPFWKSEFVVKNDKQIKKIIKAKIERVQVDSEKSTVNVEVPDVAEEPVIELVEEAVVEVAKENEPEKKSPVIEVKAPEEPQKTEIYAPDKWEPEKFMPPQLVEAIQDTKMPPAERAKVIQDYSTEMMKNILSNPNAKNIAATKDGIFEMVDVIMNEDETCANLSKLVSHDFYTYTHSVNVGVKSMLLAKEFYGKSGEHDMRELGAGFFLHDIGKVNISIDIINKKGRLTDREMNEMRKHPDESNKILSATNQLTKQSKVIVLQHHERDDGSGYPLGLKGYEIHPYASICCLADVYDALTGKRSYKEGKTPEVALEIMQKEMSNHFNKDMLNEFREIFERNGVFN